MKPEKLPVKLELPKQEPLKTDSKHFYAGMTRAEAEKKDLAKSLFTRDFSDIDKDKNGVLSDKEILQERKLEAKRERIAGGMAVAGASAFALGATVAIGGVAGTIAVANGAAFGAIGSQCFMNADKIDEESEKYAKKHNIDIEF